jgi:hypothetical protein
MTQPAGRSGRNCIGVCPTGALMFKSERAPRALDRCGKTLPASAAHSCLACEVRRCITTGVGGRIGLRELGANSHRRLAMLSPFKRSVELLDPSLSDTVLRGGSPSHAGPSSP